MSISTLPALTAGSLLMDGINIRQDQQGRFALNDLHKAAGGEQRHRPKYWLENEKTQDLIKVCGEIPPSRRFNNLEPVSVLRGGLGPQGTFVVRELVYAYAMWVSAEFHLRAIRFLDAALHPDTPEQTGPTCDALLAETRRALFQVAPELAVVHRCTSAGLTNPQTARAVGMSQRSVERVKAKLRRLGLLDAAAAPAPRIPVVRNALTTEVH